MHRGLRSLDKRNIVTIFHYMIIVAWNYAPLDYNEKSFIFCFTNFCIQQENSLNSNSANSTSRFVSCLLSLFLSWSLNAPLLLFLFPSCLLVRWCRAARKNSVDSENYIEMTKENIQLNSLVAFIHLCVTKKRKISCRRYVK